MARSHPKGLFLVRDMKGGQMSRDMTVYVDDNGRACHLYSSEDNLTLQLAELTKDYLGYTGRYWRIAPSGQNEAPTLSRKTAAIGSSPVAVRDGRPTKPASSAPVSSRGLGSN